MVIYVDLCESQFSRFCMRRRQLFKYWCNSFARSTPVGVEVRNDADIGGDEFLELARRRNVVDLGHGRGGGFVLVVGFYRRCEEGILSDFLGWYWKAARL